MSGPSRRGVLATAAAAMAAPAAAFAAGPLLMVSGKAQQGGAVIGRTRPRANILLDGESVGQASAKGLFIIGFDRDAAPEATLAVNSADGSAEHKLQIAPGDFDIQRIDGLAQDQVTPQGEALLARIRAEALTALREWPADVAMVDFRMEPVNGVEFTKLVRTAKDSANIYLPIIMLTGYADRARVLEARDSGVTELIVKPVTAQAVIARLNAVIFHPRPFVRTDAYFGPCRRRKSNAAYTGPERRSAGSLKQTG